MLSMKGGGEEINERNDHSDARNANKEKKNRRPATLGCWTGAATSLTCPCTFQVQKKSSRDKLFKTIQVEQQGNNEKKKNILLLDPSWSETYTSSPSRCIDSQL